MLEGFTPWPADRAEFYRQKGCWEGWTFGQMLEDRSKRYAKDIAVIDAYSSITYEELNERATKLAAGMQKLGIEKGDRVVVQLPNIIPYVEVVFALFKMGALPVFSLPSHRFSEISYFCRFSEAKAYIIPDQFGGFDYRNLARQVKECAPSLKHVIVVGDEEEFLSFDQVYSDEPMREVQVQGSDVAFLQLSGGSTGRSKLIPRTHDEYMYTIKLSVECCKVTNQTVFLVVLPVAHNYPMSSPGILGALYAGGKIVLSLSPSPDEAFPLIEKHRVTMVPLVPPLALHWLDVKPQRSEDLSSLEVILVGGAKFSAEAAKRIKPVFGCKLQQVFGMAEGLVCYTRLDDPEEIVLHTQGKPMSPFDEIKIVDDEDNELPVGVAGHLLTRGPYTIQGYYKAPEHNAKAFTKDGFYRTGDIVSVNEQGYLTVEGRAKDQINRGGEKIAAEEVENHLLAHPAIHDVAIVAKTDPYMGEKSCAFVIFRSAVSPRELKKFLAERGLAAYKIPDEFVAVDHFPMTHLGKVSKKDLREWIEKGPQLAR
ncbi:(2,3-dihydroxybenzoyl)adenylate synthase [Bacillus thermocopriae]|uniref:(2,3-dihydroxybenzoyl)adenylate synthase n=1 Tax=Neobacillus thermocopriae TaxID=1215031 RepID=A0A6B3TNW8_9BACI|nr:(2,3-dihydroxybenzoyl)adenylate synthase [Neobacillus thermocopriae]NEX77950.1 (2,3-dihydroxybenzoyl)adenylate synthase [Neobacillus thermocopriae]